MLPVIAKAVHFAFGALLILVVFAFPRGIAGGFVALIDALKKYRTY